MSDCAAIDMMYHQDQVVIQNVASIVKIDIENQIVYWQTGNYQRHLCINIIILIKNVYVDRTTLFILSDHLDTNHCLFSPLKRHCLHPK